MVKLIEILNKTCSKIFSLSLLAAARFYSEIPFSSCLLDYIKMSNSSSGIKREDSSAGLDILDFLLILTLILFPGGQKKTNVQGRGQERETSQKMQLLPEVLIQMFMSGGPQAQPKFLISQLEMWKNYDSIDWGTCFQLHFIGSASQLQKMQCV